MPAPGSLTTDGGGTIGGDTVKIVYNRLAFEAYRAKNVFRRVADVQWAEGDNPMPGNPVTFTLITALAVAITPISESAEPTPVNLSDATKTITLAEYGNAIKPSKKLRLTSFLNIDLPIGHEIAANMEESVDILARDVLVAGTNVLYAGSAVSRVTVGAAMNLTGNNVRRAVAKLLGNNAPPPPGSPMYVAHIHPDIAYDLMAETANSGWQAPHVYTDTANIYTGELGAFAGARFVPNANAKNFADSGVGATVDVYATTFVGQQALGEAVGEAQHMVVAGPFDDLQRFISVGWYGMLGFGRVREASLYRYEAASSIGTN